MTKKWYQDREGGTSTMRIAMMMVVVTGCVSILAYIAGIPFGVEYDVQLVVVAGGMVGVGEIAKSWQAKSGG